MSKPTRPRRPIIEAIEPRLLFSATADIAIFDDGSHYVDALAQAAADLDLVQVYFSESSPLDITPVTGFSSGSGYSDIPRISSVDSPSALASSSPTFTAPQILVFVDTSIGNYQTLVADITKNHPDDNVVVMYLDPNQNGVSIINHALVGTSNVASIHILSHGSDGNLKLGNQLINENTINNYRAQLNNWGDSLTESADILFYGCDVAANDAGLRLLQIISNITGADVAASNDDTGNTGAADWELEARTGQIETPTLLSAESDMQWEGTLPNSAPTVASVLVNQMATRDTAFTYQFAVGSFIDADGDPLTYTATLSSGASLPSWLSFNGATRTFSGTPTSDDIGRDITIKVTATDSFSASTYDEFELVFDSAPVNRVPTAPSTNEDSPLVLNAGAGLTGTYYNNTSLSGVAVGTRIDATLDFNWGNTAPGVGGLTEDNYSVRWAGDVHVTETGNYQFQTLSDDGVRVYIDGQLVIDNWTYDAAPHTSSNVALIAGKSYSVVVEYYEGGGPAEMHLNWKTPSSGSFSIIPAGNVATQSAGLYIGNQVSVSDEYIGNGLTATYYNNTTLSGPAAGTRTESAVDYFWGAGAPDGVGLNSTDNFSVRWAGDLYVTETGNYQFQTLSDDGVRVYVNGSLVIDNWTTHGPTTDTSANIALTAGQTYSIEVEYFESHNEAELNLSWKAPSSGSFSTITAGNVVTHTAGFYLGDNVNASHTYLGGGDLEVTLSVSNGTFTLPSIDNIIFTSGDGTADTTMVFTGSVANINSALAFLTYIPTNNFSGAASVTITTSDLGGTGSIKTDTDVFNITVNNVDNDAPAGADTTLVAIEDTAYSFTDADFGFNDFDIGDSISAVRIDTLATAGTLKLSGADVIAGQVITTAQLGSLTFTPAVNANGTGYGSFTFSVRDQSNIYDATPNTITFNVSSVNDAPAAIGDTVITLAEGGTATSLVGGATSVLINDTDVDGNSITAILVSDVSNGSLTFNSDGTFSYTHNGGESTSDSFTYKVNDGAIDGNTVTVSINISPVNDAPVNTVPGGQITGENVSLIFSTGNGNQIQVSDADAGSSSIEVTISVSNGLVTLGGTSGLSFVSGDGTNDATMVFNGTVADINTALTILTYTPNTNYSGGDSLSITTKDLGNTGAGGILQDTDLVAITVTNVNNAPSVTITPASYNATEQLALTLQGTGISVSDADGNPQTVTLTVTGVASQLSAVVGATGVIISSGNGTNTLVLTGTLSELNDFFSGNNAGTLSYLYAGDNPGVSETLSISASDGLLSSNDSAVVNISSVNDTPTVANAIPNQNATEDTAFNFQFASNTFSDTDVGDTLTYTAQLNGGGALPSWLSFNAATRTFSGTPTNAFVGTVNIDVAADDGNGGTVTDTFAIVVANTNDVPTIANAIPNQNATEDLVFNFQFASNTFGDTDVGDTLTYTAQLNGGGALPSWLSFNAATRTFSGTPTNAFVGTVNIDVTADDGNGGTVTDTFAIVVANTNDAPTVANAIPNQSATEDTAFNFQFASNTFNDIDAGDALTYTAQLNGGGTLPAWLSFNAATRTFSGTPTNTDVGTMPIDVIADDGNGGVVTDTFNIVIANANDAPTVANAIPNQNATEDTAFNFQFASNTFNDQDVGDTLNYTAQLNGGGALPSWLSFNAATRTFSGTPTNAFVGAVNIDVTADDGNGGTVTDTFAIVVANNNDAPTVVNVIPNQNATEDTAFNFQFASNTFNDVDVADTLTYTAQLNGGGALPSWLSFNAATRTFSGTPTNAFVGTVNIDVTADDDNGGTVTDTFAIVVANTNDAPTVANAIPNQNATEDSVFNFQFASNTFGDTDVGDTLTYTAQLNGGGVLPAWLSFNAATRAFSGTPTNADVGTMSIDVIVDDGNGGVVTDTFNIVIANANDAPTVANAIPNQSATEDTAFNFQFASNTFGDTDVGDTLTYTAQLNGGGVLPAWLSFNAATRTFSGTPTNTFVGTVNIDVTADDGNGGTVTDTFAIVVANTNDAPTVANAIPNQSATEDTAFNFQFASNTFNDIDAGDALTYTAQLNGGGALPAWLSFNAATRAFSGTPTNADVGIISIDVIADDGNGGVVTDTFNIVIANANDAPAVVNAIPNQSATEDTAFNFQFASNTFSDTDVGDTLTYTAQLNGGGALPAWLSFNAATRTFSGTPTNAFVGTVNIDVTADDGNGGTVTDTFAIVVANTNDAPTVANAIPNQNATEDSVFNFQFASNTFGDTDVGDTLTYTAQLNGGGALSSWLSFNAATRTFSGTPTNTFVGTVNIDVTADDGNGGTVTDTFAIVVANTNNAPTVVNVIPDQNATEDSVFNFQFASNTFNDVDAGDTLNYSAQLNGGGVLPAWLSFNTATRTFSGLPNAGDAQSYNIQVVATDNGGMAASTSFTLNITNINQAPTTSGIADINTLQNSAGDNVDLFVAFADREDQDAQLTYSIVSNTNNTLVTQTLIDEQTGKLQLHYGENQFGTSQITVRAIDTQGLSVDASFVVNVAFVNHAPTSTGINDIHVNQGSLPSNIDLSNVFSDVEDGKNLQYSVVANTNPALLQSIQFDQAAHGASINYNASTFGETTLTLRATDSNGDFVDSQFNITVTPQKPTDNGGDKDPDFSVLNPDNTTSGNSNDSNSNAGSNTDAGSLPGGSGIVKNPDIDNNHSDKNTIAIDPNLSDNFIGHNPTTDEPLVSMSVETHEPVADNFDPNRYDRVLQHETTIKKANDSLNNSQPLISSIILPGEGFSASDAEAFNAQVRKMRHEMDIFVAEEQQQKALLFGLTLSLTTGILIWSLRASSLLLTLISVLPLWRGIDPLPILEEVNKRKKNIEQQRKDKRIEDQNTTEVGYLFDKNNKD